MDSVKFELYGSIAFCMKQGIVKDGLIIKEITARKPWYTQEDIWRGIKKIRELVAG